MTQTRKITMEKILPEFMISEENVTYKDIPDFPGYKMGSDGSIFGCRAKGRGFGYYGKWKRLKPKANRKNDRLIIGLRKDNKAHWRYIHQLVLITFVGPRPDGMEACHNNGDFLNNNLYNLRWDTKESNTKDRMKHGTLPHGERVYLAKFKDSQVINIKLDLFNGESIMGIARKYNVSDRTVRRIKQGKAWQRISIFDEFGKLVPYQDIGCDVETKQKHLINKSGENNSKSKLTNQQVKEIKTKIRDGVKQTELAKEYNVGYGYIRNIVKGRTWKHITIEENTNV